MPRKNPLELEVGDVFVGALDISDFPSIPRYLPQNPYPNYNVFSLTIDSIKKGDKTSFLAHRKDAFAVSLPCRGVATDTTLKFSFEYRKVDTGGALGKITYNGARTIGEVNGECLDLVAGIATNSKKGFHPKLFAMRRFLRQNPDAKRQ